ncbi:MAG: hypothetical protein O7G88_19085 [bacterium]|nr:hypothetical protein [bacterium]
MTSIVLLVLAALGVAQTPAPGLSFSHLTLKIAIPKPAFVEVEPIPLTLTLTNTTAYPIQGHVGIGFQSSYIQMFVAHPDGTVQEIHSLSDVGRGLAVDGATIAPGAQYRERERLIFELDKVFPKPGDYHLQAVLNSLDDEETVGSNWLPIRIRQATGIDRQALEYMKSVGNPSYFLSDGESSNQAAKEAFEPFVVYYKTSAYGDYATFDLGHFYLVYEQYEMAVKQLRQVATKDNFAFADEALYYLIQSHAKLGEKAKATPYLDHLKSRHTKSQYVSRATRVLERLK